MAIIPVFGRRPLLKYTIERLYKKNYVGHVICVGDDPADQQACEQAGAEFINHPNSPLGAKWNAGFKRAGEYNAAACLFVGSSDWLSDNWLPTLLPQLGEFDMIGTPGCHFIDINHQPGHPPNYKLCQWPGYSNYRKGETIGIGRILSNRILKLMEWKPFNDAIDGSLDRSMHDKVLKLGGKIMNYEGNNIKALSISTNMWPNKHLFSMHESGALASTMIKGPELKDFISNEFPEADKIFL